MIPQQSSLSLAPEQRHAVSITFEEALLDQVMYISRSVATLVLGTSLQQLQGL